MDVRVIRDSLGVGPMELRNGLIGRSGAIKAVGFAPCVVVIRVQKWQLESPDQAVHPLI